MGRRVRQGTEVVAAALVLAYVGTVAFSHVGDFAPWSTNLLWLSVASAICGALLALSSLSGEEAVWSIIAAPVLAVLIFGSVWIYIWWALAGQYISLFDLILSDFVFLYVVQRGFVMFLVSVPFGVLGAVVVPIGRIY